MKLAYVITCNGVIEHVFVGERSGANTKMEKLAENNFRAMRHIYQTREMYDVNHNWSVVSAPITTKGEPEDLPG